MEPNNKVQPAEANAPAKTTIMRPGLSLPSVSRPSIETSRKQLALLVVDCSWSMHGQKIAEANAAVRALVTALADLSNRGAFFAALIGYADAADVQVEAKPVKNLDPAELELVVGPRGDMTNMTGAFTVASQVLDRSKANPVFKLPPVVVVLSDGQPNVGGDPLPAAADLRSRATVISVGFGTDADMTMLGKIATSPAHAVRCTDGASLRAHFAAIGATISVAAVSGRSVAALLVGTTYAGKKR